jgi:MoxR-like ATPase
MGVKDKIESLLKQLNEGIYEKDEVIALALLSSIAGESIFLLGPAWGGKKPYCPTVKICL